MGKSVTLGGDRVGTGNKNKVYLHGYERSNHDLSYTWKSTLASGVLVPFMSNVMTPGDTFDIDLDADIMTHPTIGPLFGSYKLQLDVYLCPIRLYQGALHNNKLGVGMKMNEVKLPMIEMLVNNTSTISSKSVDIQQINPSSLFKYIGISGVGSKNTNIGRVKGQFNAISYLAYYDIVKNYYANTQEENAFIIDYTIQVTGAISEYEVRNSGVVYEMPREARIGDVIWVNGENLEDDNIQVKIGITNYPWIQVVKTSGHMGGWRFGEVQDWVIGKQLQEVTVVNSEPVLEKPQLTAYPLSNLDDMRENILAATKTKTPFIINDTTIAPYGNNLKTIGATNYIRSYMPMQGLALKTYQSDLFNNWIKTEWIEGANGIAELTAVSVADGKLKLDALNLAKKMYDMLNRIAVSGGTYNDWIFAAYGTDSNRLIETPMYMGGLSKEIVFQEIISNTATADQPLGTLAGRGRLSSKHKGGKMTIKTDEPSYVIGIVSITPRITYSQGNNWDVHLKTMDDFHKPGLDGIGFQDLITDQMAYWDTSRETDTPVFRSAGKITAWANYMTAIDKAYGHFADENSEMFMTLNRRYEMGSNKRIKDLTTYIDPAKYNYIFAETDRSAQNFWAQINVGIYARRKISAQQIPNL